MSDATFTIRLKCAGCGAWITADKANADKLNDIMARFILSTCESGHIKPSETDPE